MWKTRLKPFILNPLTISNNKVFLDVKSWLIRSIIASSGDFASRRSIALFSICIPPWFSMPFYHGGSYEPIGNAHAEESPLGILGSVMATQPNTIVTCSFCTNALCLAHFCHKRGVTSSYRSSRREPSQRNKGCGKPAGVVPCLTACPAISSF